MLKAALMSSIDWQEITAAIVSYVSVVGTCDRFAVTCWFDEVSAGERIACRHILASVLARALCRFHQHQLSMLTKGSRTEI